MLASPSTEEGLVGGGTLRGGHWLAGAGVSEEYARRLALQFLEKVKTATIGMRAYCLGRVPGTGSGQEANRKEGVPPSSSSLTVSL